jgi:hypothetical protein
MYRRGGRPVSVDDGATHARGSGDISLFNALDVAGGGTQQLVDGQIRVSGPLCLAKGVEYGGLDTTRMSPADADANRDPVGGLKANAPILHEKVRIRLHVFQCLLPMPPNERPKQARQALSSQEHVQRAIRTLFAPSGGRGCDLP